LKPPISGVYHPTPEEEEEEEEGGGMNMISQSDIPYRYTYSIIGGAKQKKSGWAYTPS